MKNKHVVGLMRKLSKVDSTILVVVDGSQVVVASVVCVQGEEENEGRWDEDNRQKM